MSDSITTATPSPPPVPSVAAVPSPDPDMASLSAVLESLKARAVEFESTHKAHAESPAAKAATKSSPAPFLPYSVAAKRTLAQAVQHVERALAELVGHANHSATAASSFASAASLVPAGSPVPTEAEVAAWAASKGYVKATPTTPKETSP